MNKKLLFLLFVCAGIIYNNSFCMQNCSDLSSMSIIQPIQEAQLQAAWQELQENSSALYDAACNNDLQRVRLLLAAGADINSRDIYSDYTSLHIAALKGYKELIELLLQHPGADVNVRSDIIEDTSLHMAVSGNCKEVAQLLLEHQADVNARTFSNITPLHSAVFWNKEELIKLLLQYGADIAAQNKFGETPLHDAKNLQVLKLLLSSQLEMQSLQLKLKEALVLEPKHVSLQHVLSIKDAQGRTVRDRAVEDGKQDIVDFIDNVLKFAGSIQSNNFRMQRRNQLLLCEIPWDQIQAARQELKQNPLALHNAAWKGNLQKIRLLLVAGADVNALNITSWTPLHIAAAQGCKEVVALLLQHPNANINVGTGSGEGAPLHKASANDHKEVARFLLDHQANINARNIGYRTPLHDAIFKNDLRTSYKASKEMIKLLLQYGADITAQEKFFGETSLHRAVNLDVLKVLLSELLEVPALKKLCLRRIKALGLSQERLPQELKEAVASEPKPVSLRYALSIKDKEGKTVRDRAVEKGNKDIVDFIDSVLKNAKT